MTVIPSLPMPDYVADRLPGGDRPFLSASIAHTLLSESPRHAWHKHPRLNPAYQREEDGKFDLGTACHAVMLGDDGVTFQIIEGFNDWKKAAAKGARDAARRIGRLPLLAHQYEQACEMAAAAKAQLAIHEIGNPFTNGRPEVTLTWEQMGVLCKARLDWMPTAATIGVRGDICFYDLKTTTDTANPDYVDRRLSGTGAYLQAAMHSDGIRANFPGVVPRFRFVMIEASPPYALSVIEPNAVEIEEGAKDVVRALRTWSQCLASERWPGYPSKVCSPDPRSCRVTQAVEREAVEDAERQAGIDRLAIGMDWTAPSRTLEMWGASIEDV